MVIKKKKTDEPYRYYDFSTFRKDDNEVFRGKQPRKKMRTTLSVGNIGNDSSKSFPVEEFVFPDLHNMEPYI
jgi:hypothetical protein